jgi:glucose uptake protein GlcU
MVEYLIVLLLSAVVAAYACYHFRELINKYESDPVEKAYIVLLLTGGFSYLITFVVIQALEILLFGLLPSLAVGMLASMLTPIHRPK